MTQASRPCCCRTAAPPSAIPAPPPRIILPFPCFPATQTCGCGTMLCIPPTPRWGESPPGLPILLQPCFTLPPASVPSSGSVSPLPGKQQVQETGQLLGGRISNPQTPLAVPSPPAHPDGGQQKLGGRAKGTKEDQMPPVRTLTQARQTRAVAGVGTRS